MDKIKAFFNKVWALLRVDGVIHIAVSSLIVVFFGTFLPIWVSALICLLVGIGKEVYDYSRVQFNPFQFGWDNCLHDIICDIIGLLWGCVMVALYNI